MKAVTETRGHLMSLLQLVEVGRIPEGTGLFLTTAKSLELPKLCEERQGLRDGHIT